MDRKVTYNQLKHILCKLGYTEATSGTNIVFLQPERRLFIVLPRMRLNEEVKPMDLLSVQNTLANSGIVPKERFLSLFDREPIELWHAIIEAEAAFEIEHGHPPKLLELPVLQAYDLAKLRRQDFGPLSERVMREGIKVFEREGLLGVPVILVPGGVEFEFK